MSGLTPPSILSYIGQVVVPFINRTFPPQDTFLDFSVPTVWIDTAHNNAYILVSKALGVADWVHIGGTPGEIDTITTPDATVVVPTAGNINFLNGTGMNITGSGSSITFNVSGGVATLYTEDSGTAAPSSGNLIITGGSTGLTTLGSGHTVSLTGTLNVGHGGTSATSFTANGAVISNTTTTGALSAVALASQKFLVGTSGAPIAKGLSTVIQTITTTGTYTPTVGMVYCIIEVVGGGGGGGGVATQGATNSLGASGGGAGGYSRKSVSAATIGASQTVTIGAGGAGGAAGNNNGVAGGTTSVGATILQATGGSGGAGSPDLQGGRPSAPGGVGSLGDLNANGQPGSPGFGAFVVGATSLNIPGNGGSSVYGGGGLGISAVGGASNAGGDATLYGSGGGGATAANGGTQQAGGAGSAGIAVITEYVIS